MTEQAARARAVEVATTGAMHIGGSTVPPTNIQATKLAVGETSHYLAEHGWPAQIASDQSLGSGEVWLVTMDGLWATQGGPPTVQSGPSVPPPSFHHCAIVIDAQTGETLEMFARQ